ncbi:hypothetical protein [Levilactobacillus parabrevis]|uniref:hypothetical protein n=1 Tax=Levilactobacillus parabrevis TaxID=357278 RepID=UPI0021A828D3|nr:hypothetical protein [Levilactobacillus parabrevis]
MDYPSFSCSPACAENIWLYVHVTKKRRRIKQFRPISPENNEIFKIFEFVCYIADGIVETGRLRLSGVLPAVGDRLQPKYWLPPALIQH